MLKSMRVETLADGQKVMVDNIDKVLPAFLRAQRKVEAIKKTTANAYFKNNYADLSAVIEGLKKHFNDEGLIITQGIRVDRMSLPTDSGTSLTIATESVLETFFMHESGQYIGFEHPIVVAEKKKDDPQAFGAAESYAKRYALLAAAGVPTEDDDGEGAVSRTNTSSFKTNTTPTTAATTNTTTTRPRSGGFKKAGA